MSEASRCDPGGRYLLCSDGLTDVVALETMERALSESDDDQAIVEELLARTLAGGAPDNVSIVLASVCGGNGDIGYRHRVIQFAVAHDKEARFWNRATNTAKPYARGGVATDQGPATVREGGAAPQQGGATVREGGAATVREGGAAPQRGGATVREGPQQAAADAREPWIPDTIASDYRIVRPLLAAGGEASLYVVAPRNSTDTRELVAKVYDEGVDLDEGVLQRVCDADLEHLIQIEDYGQDAGRWWELMEYAEYGQPAQSDRAGGTGAARHLGQGHPSGN